MSVPHIADDSDTDSIVLPQLNASEKYFDEGKPNLSIPKSFSISHKPPHANANNISISLGSAGAYTRRESIVAKLRCETKLSEMTVEDVFTNNFRRFNKQPYIRKAMIQAPGSPLQLRPRGSGPIAFPEARPRTCLSVSGSVSGKNTLNSAIMSHFSTDRSNKSKGGTGNISNSSSPTGRSRLHSSESLNIGESSMSINTNNTNNNNNIFNSSSGMTPNNKDACTPAGRVGTADNFGRQIRGSHSRNILRSSIDSIDSISVLSNDNNGGGGSGNYSGFASPLGTGGVAPPMTACTRQNSLSSALSASMSMSQMTLNSSSARGGGGGCGGNDSVATTSRPDATNYFSRPTARQFISSNVMTSEKFTMPASRFKKPLNVISHHCPPATCSSMDRSILPAYADDILSECSYASIAMESRRKFQESTPNEDRLYLSERRKFPEKFKPKLITQATPPYTIDYAPQGSAHRHARDVFLKSPMGFF